ncbi:MAG: glycosyltransferase [Phycisphaeraceae bacterium]|nr:glycosyltransferase [Phycisphaeraceae bacterium]
MDECREEGEGRRLAPLLISLPHGLDLGGVTSWAVRLANGLAERGRGVALIVHPRAADQPAAEIRLHAAVRRIEPSGWPHMGEAEGDLSPFVSEYRRAISGLARAAYGPGGGPVVVMPNILGDSYGLFATLCATQAETLRVLAWQHADSEYDTSILRRYEPVISRYVAIDERYVRSLGAMFPGREGDIETIPHGVEVPATPAAARPPLPGRPLRLVYTGRMEHRQKRVGALALLSDELGARGIDHRITLVGSGPAEGDVDRLISKRPRVHRIARADAAQIGEMLRGADAFVLASRFEGLCISRIEAMAQGCVPVITAANSGATSGLCDGESAVFVGARPEDDEAATAASLAEGLERFLAMDRDAMSLAAWRAAREHFSIDRHVERAGRAIDDAAAGPARWWRTDWPSAFSSSRTSPGMSGSVGPEGARRMVAALARLAGRRVVLHGAGRHTIELASALANSRAEIVAVSDDDRQRWGSRLLGWPVIAPESAAEHGATDVVISSYIHQRSIWERRGVYERQGLRVHAVYPLSPADATSDAGSRPEPACAA